MQGAKTGSSLARSLSQGQDIRGQSSSVTRSRPPSAKAAAASTGGSPSAAAVQAELLLRLSDPQPPAQPSVIPADTPDAALKAPTLSMPVARNTSSRDDIGQPNPMGPGCSRGNWARLWTWRKSQAVALHSASLQQITKPERGRRSLLVQGVQTPTGQAGPLGASNLHAAAPGQMQVSPAPEVSNRSVKLD